MEIKTTIITGLTFSALVEEVNHRDRFGGLICYIATLYRIDKKTSVRHLIHRSRIPGAAAEMKRNFDRDGIQAFRRLERV
ncbi:hypothetical protein ACC778_08245 [Rhizobium ruizarguesonis]